MLQVLDDNISGEISIGMYHCLVCELVGTMLKAADESGCADVIEKNRKDGLCRFVIGAYVRRGAAGDIPVPYRTDLQQYSETEAGSGKAGNLPGGYRCVY